MQNQMRKEARLQALWKLPGLDSNQQPSGSKTATPAEPARPLSGIASDAAGRMRCQLSYRGSSILKLPGLDSNQQPSG
jgi:hypothetical protein